MAEEHKKEEVSIGVPPEGTERFTETSPLLGESSQSATHPSESEFPSEPAPPSHGIARARQIAARRQDRDTWQHWGRVLGYIAAGIGGTVAAAATHIVFPIWPLWLIIMIAISGLFTDGGVFREPLPRGITLFRGGLRRTMESYVLRRELLKAQVDIALQQECVLKFLDIKSKDAAGKKHTRQLKALFRDWAEHVDKGEDPEHDFSDDEQAVFEIWRQTHATVLEELTRYQEGHMTSRARGLLDERQTEIEVKMWLSRIMICAVVLYAVGIACLSFTEVPAAVTFLLASILGLSAGVVFWLLPICLVGLALLAAVANYFVLTDYLVRMVQTNVLKSIYRYFEKAIYPKDALFSKLSTSDQLWHVARCVLLILSFIFICVVAIAMATFTASLWWHAALVATTAGIAIVPVFHFGHRLIFGVTRAVGSAVVTGFLFVQSLFVFEKGRETIDALRSLGTSLRQHAYNIASGRVFIELYNTFMDAPGWLGKTIFVVAILYSLLKLITLPAMLIFHFIGEGGQPSQGASYLMKSINVSIVETMAIIAEALIDIPTTLGVTPDDPEDEEPGHTHDSNVMDDFCIELPRYIYHCGHDVLAYCNMIAPRPVKVPVEEKSFGEQLTPILAKTLEKGENLPFCVDGQSYQERDFFLSEDKVWRVEEDKPNEIAVLSMTSKYVAVPA